MKLNIGYNFDKDLIEVFRKLNETSTRDGQIQGVYGSTVETAWLSARPDFRLPDIDFMEFADHVNELNKIGIDFNFTMNAPYLGTKQEIYANEEYLIRLLNELSEVGVKRVIISNPILLDLYSRKAKEVKINFELSTIMHIDTPMQLQAFKQLDNRIDKVVGNILYNRDFRKLKIFSTVCRMLDMDYEVMVNEFCGITSQDPGKKLIAHCIYRDSCYACHSGNKTKKDAMLMRNYPMSKCMSSRSHNAADWLRTFFVRPQDLYYYEGIGINTFKVTGRTAQTPYIKYIAESYLTRTFDDNILKLWKQLETIYSGKEELDEHKYKFNLPANKLDDFMLPFVRESLNCSDLLCEDCQYCDKWADYLIEESKDE